MKAIRTISSRAAAAIPAGVLCSVLMTAAAQRCFADAPATRAADDAETRPATRASESRPATRAAETRPSPPPEYDENISFEQWTDSEPIVYQMLVAAGIVLVLGALTYVLMKRFLPGLRKPAEGGISIVASAYLGPKKTAHVLKVGSRKILVACWRDGVAPLGDVTNAFEDDSKEPSASFRQVARDMGAEQPQDSPENPQNPPRPPES